ncbi:MAG: histidinol dehydrogenase [Endomicrobiia bacterium]
MTELYFKVKQIIDEVNKNGDLALVKYTRIFDKISNFDRKDLLVKVEPVKIFDRKFVSAIKYAIKNVRKFHLEEKKRIKKTWFFNNKGMVLGQKIVPIESVGIYVPGGKYGYNYVSSLIMSVVPAQVAVVKNIVVLTPPKNVSEYFLYTCNLLGIKKVYAVGGVQAIAAASFGTESVPKVDLIIGPGNKWVTESKRQLFGTVGIDLLAGPSEVVVVADKTVSLDEIVYELLAQIEHDIDARSVLISLDRETIKKVKLKIESIDKRYLKQVEFIFTKSIFSAIELVNKISPEHLTFMLDKNINQVIHGIKNAGAIFLGRKSSTVFGDYIAGPSHILPTNRTANFSSGVSVQTFMKKISVVKFSSKFLKSNTTSASKIAEVEGMVYHKSAVLSKVKN